MRIGKAAAVIAPVALAGTLFFVALKLGDPGRALAEIRRLPLSVVAAAICMAVVYLVEIIVVLSWLAVFGIRGWPAIRPAAVAAAVVLCLLLAFVLHFEGAARRLARRFRRPALHRALNAAIDIISGLHRLSNVHILAINFVVATAYLGALVLAFMLVGRHAGLAYFGYLEAATTYAFALAVVFLTGGLISQIGTVEVLGMSAAQAGWGVPYAEGLTLMLGFRVVWTGAMWLCNLPIVALLWRT